MVAFIRPTGGVGSPLGVDIGLQDAQLLLAQDVEQPVLYLNPWNSQQVTLSVEPPWLNPVVVGRRFSRHREPPKMVGFLK